MARATMFLGTCRMHDPCEQLRRNTRLRAKSTPHRLHTAMQTLQFVRFMAGRAVYTERNVHLLSDFAAREVLDRGKPAAAVLEDLQRLRASWSCNECYVVEICTLREYSILRRNGERFWVNTFCRRDLAQHAVRNEELIAAGLIEAVRADDIELHVTGAAELLRTMREIASLLGKPVLWVSHVRPGSDSPAFATLNKTRRHLAELLSAAADQLGHEFFDPTLEATAMGYKQFFHDDLDHLSAAGAVRMSQVYARFVSACR